MSGLLARCLDCFGLHALQTRVQDWEPRQLTMLQPTAARRKRERGARRRLASLNPVPASLSLALSLRALLAPLFGVPFVWRSLAVIAMEAAST